MDMSASATRIDELQTSIDKWCNDLHRETTHSTTMHQIATKCFTIKSGVFHTSPQMAAAMVDLLVFITYYTNCTFREKSTNHLVMATFDYIWLTHHHKSDSGCYEDDCCDGSTYNILSQETDETLAYTAWFHHLRTTLDPVKEELNKSYPDGKPANFCAKLSQMSAGHRAILLALTHENYRQKRTEILHLNCTDVDILISPADEELSGAALDVLLNKTSCIPPLAKRHSLELKPTFNEYLHNTLISTLRSEFPSDLLQNDWHLLQQESGEEKDDDYDAVAMGEGGWDSDGHWVADEGVAERQSPLFSNDR